MLREKLGGHTYVDPPIRMFGAGIHKHLSDMNRLNAYSRAADLVVIGSITRESNQENAGDRLQGHTDTATLNSWGMPNGGMDSLGNTAPFDNLIVSVAGKSIDDYLALYHKLSRWGKGIELNLGCPNTGGGIMSFDIPRMIELLEEIESVSYADSLSDDDPIIGVKLSPYSDPGQLKEVANMLTCYSDVIDYVATCNTFPLGKARQRDTHTTIHCGVTKDRGGVSGSALREISLGQASQFVEHFSAMDSSIEVIRVGGVSTGKDLLDSQLEGCAGVQVVTAGLVRHHVMFDIMDQYVSLKTPHIDPVTRDFRYI